MREFIRCFTLWASAVRIGFTPPKFFVGELFQPPRDLFIVRGCACAKFVDEFFRDGTILRFWRPLNSKWIR